jgi:hypothetical protein
VLREADRYAYIDCSVEQTIDCVINVVRRDSNTGNTPSLLACFQHVEALLIDYETRETSNYL